MPPKSWRFDQPAMAQQCACAASARRLSSRTHVFGQTLALWMSVPLRIRCSGCPSVVQLLRTVAKNEPLWSSNG